MLHLGNIRDRRTGTLVLAFVLALSMTMMVGETATTALATTSATSATPAAAAKPVAQTEQGVARSKITGTAGHQRTVTGSFVPLKFVKHQGTVKVRGLISGVVHKADGSTRTFSVLRAVKVASIDGVDLASASQSAARGVLDCEILHLVLGPLDLDLLGLQVHLDRIVLDVVAVLGAGNLVGNLLCAVTHLLDGGLVGALAELVALLNQILALLGLGL